MPKILAFAGSTRKESYNRALIKIAAGFADVTLIELSDFPLPIYNGDYEEASGIPENAQKLKRLFLDHDALLLSCPEYNGSITPLLKNTIDWVSRKEGDEPPLAAYRGKVAALLAAAPGSLGGLRGLVHVRAILGGIGVLVIPQQLAVPRANEGFDDATKKKVQGVVDALVETTKRLHG